MYEDGALEIGCQTSFMVPCSSGSEGWTDLTNTHTLFAGTSEVKIHFKGKGGHAAFHMKLMTPW